MKNQPSPPSELSIEELRNGVSCIPQVSLARLGEYFGINRGAKYFRSYSDSIADALTKDEVKLAEVLKEYNYIFETPQKPKYAKQKKEKNLAN